MNYLNSMNDLKRLVSGWLDSYDINQYNVENYDEFVSVVSSDIYDFWYLKGFTWGDIEFPLPNHILDKITKKYEL